MSDHDLIDNLDRQLDQIVASSLELSKRAHIVLGHLFIPGLSPIIENMARSEKIRLLIGNSTHNETVEQLYERHLNPLAVKQEVGRQLYAKRPDLRKIIRKAADDLKETIALMDQSDESLYLLRTLTHLVEQNRLQLRIFPRGRLTAKAYLFEPEVSPGKSTGKLSNHAVLGSTNLSHSEVAHPAELNVVVRGEENYTEILSWFDRLWGQSEEFGQLLIDAIRSSWAGDQSRPYDVYMKTLYSLLKDRLEDDPGLDNLTDDKIVSDLAPFQEEAVRRASRIIREFGGAFVADVVGLGKSFIGAAILKQFGRTDRARGLIICPATLIPMWERYNEHYDLNARVVSIGLLREGEGSANILLEDVRFRDRNFVLVDESHNFRNTDTQRYRLLQQFVANGRQCCFLTATPRNKSCWDIFNQIKLFHQEDKTDLPIDPPDLREYFRLVDRGERNLPELLSNILIRRTRAHIIKVYGRDSETDELIDLALYSEYRSGKRRCYVEVADRKQYFPTRELQTVDYSIEETYQGIYQDLRTAIGSSTRRAIKDELPPGLTFARYATGRYLRAEKQDDPRYSRLKGATAALHGLIRILLFKRFESSVEAFRETVKRMIATHSAYNQAIVSGMIPTEEDVEIILQDLGEEQEEVRDPQRPVVKRGYDLKDFNREYLLRDLEHDLRILRHILDMVMPIAPEKDAKLAKLLLILGEPPLADNKRLIFTQYTDTAEYLYRNLNPAGRDPGIKVLHSGVKAYSSIIGRFAPRSNPALRAVDAGTEIMTLIATDILSEGMNLQDCNSIINYDLHWNPVRLIQRFGRIDRIGTDHDVIRGFNFLPEVGLERNLGLRRRLQLRIQDIHDTIGEDSAILDSSERLNESAMYAIYEPGEATEAIFEQEESEEMVDLNDAEAILRRLKMENPDEFDRIANLPDGIRSGKPARTSGTYVLCRAGRYHKAFLFDTTGKGVTIDTPHILGLIKCGPEIDPVPLFPEHSRNVVTAKALFEEEYQNRAVERDHSKSYGKGQRHILHELRKLISEGPDDETRDRILLFDKLFRGAIPNSVRRELNLIRRDGITGNSLLNELARIYHDQGMRNRPDRDEREIDMVPRIVCSMTLR